MNQPLINNSLISHYRIISKLGAGGMGEVWLAEDTRLGRRVALKLLPAEFTEDSERVRRFTLEAKAASALNHPNIIAVYDIGECASGRFIVMEFVAGRTLRSVIAKDNSLDTLFALGAQMAKALSTAHEAGIAHRDIKPDNIMVRDDGYVKMLDFGLARLLPTTASDQEAMTLAQQTTPGTVMGTLAYMSPEQASGKTVGSASDVFALGIVLYELATGHHPFKSETMIGYLHAITSQVPPSLTSLKSHLPPALDDLILRMLEKEANSRPTAGEVAQALIEIERYGSSKTLPFRVADKPEERFLVAVLPFKSSGAAAELKELAEGLSEDIVTGLSRFSYLRVIALNSTVDRGGKLSNVKTLGARYVMEGSLRQSGTKLRLAVQLVDATTGAHLWAENYERAFSPETIFELQDDLAPRIVSTVADQYGALVHSMSESLRGRSAGQYSAHEAVLRAFGYWERMTPEEHAEVREILEAAIATAPDHSDCLAELASIYWHEYAFGYNLRPDPVGRARAAAQRAVASAPTSHFAHCALATSLFFQKDYLAFRPAAERALALNRMDSSTAAILGNMIAYAGDWQYGLDIVERAMQLNPHHAGWYHYVAFCDSYRKHDYQGALASALKVNMPTYRWPHVYLAAVYGQLGEQQRATAALKELHVLVPNFGAIAREEFGKWLDPELTEHLLDGLRKAGLEIADEDRSADASPTVDASGEKRVDEGFWVAVLPFKFTGSNTEVATLAEGLSEEIVTGLSRFSYLRVISRSSTYRSANETDDVRTVGKTLGARYVLEGSLRIAGPSLRVSVQLLDATTGAHLWAETYDRQFRAEEIFALQDDLVPRIVSTVADINGILPRSMSETVCSRSGDELSPYEAVLRSFRYYDRVTPEELRSARSCLELAVKKAPTYGDAWAMLALLCVQDYAQGFDLQSDSLSQGATAAQRAVEAAPTSHLAYFSLAQAQFFQKELQSFRNSAERAVALNPMDGNLLAFVGELLTYMGDSERGLALATRAKQFNPNHPGWFWYADFFHAYRQGDYRDALNLMRKANLPGHWGMHAGIAACAGQLGDHEAAARAVSDLLKVRPDFSATVRTVLEKWFDPELRESFIDGLRKAGLEIAVEEEGAHHVSSEKRADEGFWIAVLPFKFTGSEQLGALAEGLSEEIVTGLSRFSYLRVIARGSTLRYVDNVSDVPATGRKLGARYVMSGSLRQAGSSLRVTVQIIDSTNETHLWAETYERTFSPETIFAVQDDLVPRIVSSVADPHGILPYTISEFLRAKEPDELSPYEAVMRSFGYGYRFSPAELSSVTTALQRAVEKAPDYADAWAMFSLTQVEGYASGFNLQPDTLERALKAAQRAIEIGAANAIAYNALAKTRFFRKEFQAFRIAAERAIDLNPLNGPTIASLGGMIAYAGEWDRGCALIERAAQFHKQHPGWYWFPLFYKSYRLGEYADALSIALKINLPLFFSTHVVTAAAYGQLGNREGAEIALKELFSLKPDFVVTAREDLGKWLDPELMEHMIAGLRKAGLEIASGNSSSSVSAELTSARSSPGFASRPAIVVLPFVNRSPDPDNEYFSDGLTEEIISDLSIIKSLRVISRNSSMTFKGTSKDTLSIAKELGVTHVVSGSVRKVNDDLRITAELIEAVSDTPLWNEKYSGTMANVFGFQEEISRKIVNALQVQLTDVETQVIADRPIDNTAAYDCYMRARHEIYRFTAEGLDRAQKLVDSGLSLIRENPLLLATRGMVSWYYLNFSIRPDERYLDEAAAYAARALDQDPDNYLGIFLRGLVASKRGDIEGAISDLQAAHKKKPGDAMVLNEWVRHHFSAGQEQSELAAKMFEESLRVDPLHPLNWAQAAWRHFDAGRLAQSVEAARRIFHLTDRGNPARVYGAYYLAIAGELSEAVTIFDTEGAALPGTAYGSVSLFLSRALQRDAEGAVKQVTPQLEQAASWTEYLALFLADGYALIGHDHEAIKWLRTSVDQGFINYPYLATRDPLLANVRSDPRFTELMREVKARWEALMQNLSGSLQAQAHPVQVSPTSSAHPEKPYESERDALSDHLQFVDVSNSSKAQLASADDKLKLIQHSPSIAVLPFVNISNDTDNEYFCYGLAEEMLNALAKVESLHVAARTSAFSFKGKEADIRDIGAKLSVSTVLEGSVRKSGNRVRISVQLVNVADGYHLWSEKYDRQLEDIFDIQDEISLAIVAALKVKLLGTEKQAVVKRYTENTAAYQLYLKGRFFVNQRTSESLLKAIGYFNQAIALDANYVLGYAGLADAYMVLGVPDAVTEALSPLDSLTKARAAAEKALQLDSSVSEVYAALAHIKWKQRDWAGAENDYKRSIDLNPQNPTAHFYHAVCLAGLGQCDDAVKEIRRAQELDPLSLPVNASIVYVLYLCRRYDEAIDAGKKTLDLDVTFPLTHQRLGLPYTQKKMYREAIAEFEAAVNNSKRAPQPLILLAYAYAVSGNNVEAKKVLAEIKDLSRERYVSPCGIAAIYVGLGDTEQAFDWLEKAFDEDNTELTFLKVDPRFDPLHADPRFQKLLERAGFPM